MKMDGHGFASASFLSDFCHLMMDHSNDAMDIGGLNPSASQNGNTHKRRYGSQECERKRARVSPSPTMQPESPTSAGSARSDPGTFAESNPFNLPRTMSEDLSNAFSGCDLDSMREGKVHDSFEHASKKSRAVPKQQMPKESTFSRERSGNQTPSGAMPSAGKKGATKYVLEVCDIEENPILELRRGLRIQHGTLERIVSKTTVRSVGRVARSERVEVTIAH